MELAPLIKEFINKISKNEVEIYNEASIQYELAIFLRQKLGNYKIQLERNVSYFDLDKTNFEKKEIDIVISNGDEKCAIEIKFPVNGQHPEQMFSFAKDIKFLEELKSNGFQNNIFIAFANDSKFWNNDGKEGTIYEMFRKNKKIYGKIQKPTGLNNKTIDLEGEYDVDWKDVNSSVRYFMIQL